MRLKKLKSCKNLINFCFFIFILFYPFYTISCSYTILPKKEIIIYKTQYKKKFPFIVEIANDDIKRKKGLQCRRSLKKNEGMLFEWKNEEFRYFWMKNTTIPLDLIFINSNLKIIDVFYNASPNDHSIISSKKKAMYILELNAGIFKSLNLQVGDLIKK